jgi:hypothetical protein
MVKVPAQQLEMFDGGDRRSRKTSTHPGRRITDGPKPLKTRECADYIGQGLDFIYGLIADGTLKAEYLVTPGKKRGTWVVPQDEWIRCLKKLKWSRIPKIG